MRENKRRRRDLNPRVPEGHRVSNPAPYQAWLHLLQIIPHHISSFEEVTLAVSFEYCSTKLSALVY